MQCPRCKQDSPAHQGRPDVIVFVEAPNHKTLGQIVLQKIQRAPGVEATDTRILVEM